MSFRYSKDFYNVCGRVGYDREEARRERSYLRRESIHDSPTSVILKYMTMAQPGPSSTAAKSGGCSDGICTWTTNSAGTCG